MTRRRYGHQGVVLAAVAGDRADPRFVKLFPTTVTDAMRPVGGDTQDAFVRAMIGRLRNDESVSEWKARADELEVSTNDVATAMNSRKALYVAEQQASNDQQLIADRARREYRLIKSRLELQFPDDSALVESFFNMDFAHVAFGISRCN
ncbi:MAG: hypothetical protein HYV07_08450 [Deltaproteobacteria bacterium]|nr:hypothetical protein [Deltaproteobacteria bacterium]